MKEILLKRLTLENFQGGNFTLEANGEDATIYAQNGKGKTRLFTAWCYLFFGRDSLGRTQFEIKNIKPDGEHEHGLDHLVEAIISNDEVTMALKKLYREKWSSSRNKADKVMSGHENLYFIDDVSKTETEFKEIIRMAMADDETLSLIANPMAFATMPDKKGVPGWQRQRGILLSVVGDVTTAHVIASDDQLAPLTELLIRFTVSKTPVDDLKKVLKASRAETTKLRNDIPVAIKENRRIMPDVTDLNRQTLCSEITTLEAQLNNAKLKLAGVDNGADIATFSKHLETMKAELSGLQNKHFLKGMEAVNKLNSQIRGIADDAQTEERKRKSLEADIAAKQERITFLDTKIVALREKWAGFNAEEFQDSTECICPACGQNLPEERVEEAREKARAEFNDRKATKLGDIAREGKGHATEKERQTKDIEGLTEALAKLASLEKQDKLTELTALRDTAKAAAEDFSDIPGRNDLLAQIEAYEKAIAGAKESVQGDHDKVHAEIGSIEAKLREVREKEDLFAKRESGEKRIKELMAQEKEYAKQIEEMEKQLYLCELFTRTKVAMLDERIQAKFKRVQFKLFKQNVTNEGIDDCCEITVNGVPFNAGLNSGARIMAGLEICNVLQEHYGIRAPVFVDDAEKFTSPIEMDCQVIKLVASPEDTVLRVEMAEEERPRRAAGGGLF